MNRARLLWAALALVLGLASCQLPSAAGFGSVTVVLPGAGDSRAVTANGGKGNLVRIQLVQNGVTVPLSGQSYLQQSLAGQSITLSSLPTGTGYQLYVSTGQLASSGFFETAYYQASSTFQISAGATTAVNVTLSPTPIGIVEDTGTSYSHSSAYFNSQGLYYLNGSSLDSLTGDPASPTSGPSLVTTLPSGVTINSLSAAETNLWLNTSSGIYSSSGTGSFAAVNMLSVTNTTISPIAVSGSGLTAVSSYTFAYFYGPGSVLGLTEGASTTSGPGFNTNQSPLWTLFGAQGLSASTDGSNFVYLATSRGTFRIPYSLITSTSATAGALAIALAAGSDSSGSLLVTTEDGAPITQVGVCDNSLSSTVYAFGGTAKGLYAAPVNTTGIPQGDGKLQLISATKGLSITSLSSYQWTSGTTSGQRTFTAAYSSTTGEVLLFNDLTLVARFPALAGLPSGTPQFTWYPYISGNTYSLYLVITGTDATVRYLAGSYTQILSS